MPQKNVFVVGYDEFNIRRLKRLPNARHVAFYPALRIEDMRSAEEMSIQALIDKAVANVEESGVTPDGFCAYFDFPAMTLVPILAEKYGTRGPKLEAVLACEHKYWSRLEQQKAIPEHIPGYRAFDPFDEEAYRNIDLFPPFWIKPIKSFRSFLAYQINGPAQFDTAMVNVREHIRHYNGPFQELMERFEMPDEFTQMPELCIAEHPIGGAQCTVEGYSLNGNVVCYGVVDSIREADRSSFGRYQYPSALPLEVQHRMIDVVRRAITQIGLDNSCFNVEFFWDPFSDQVWLLEINPRLSQSHSDIFEKVHGQSHLGMMLALCLGEKPRPLRREGKFNLAAHFMVRVFEPGIVTQVPSEAEIETAKEKIPGLDLKVNVKEGDDLAKLRGQDSYSFELASIFLGARDQSELVERYAQALELLPFHVRREEEAEIH